MKSKNNSLTGKVRKVYIPQSAHTSLNCSNLGFDEFTNLFRKRVQETLKRMKTEEKVDKCKHCLHQRECLLKEGYSHLCHGIGDTSADINRKVAQGFLYIPEALHLDIVQENFITEN
jgi:hypothetical protein